MALRWLNWLRCWFAVGAARDDLDRIERCVHQIGVCDDCELDEFDVRVW